VHNIGQEVMMTFITTEYLATKIDLSFRSGCAAWSDLRVEETALVLLDSKGLKSLRAASKIQSLVRGRQSRKRTAPFLRCLFLEMSSRVKLFHLESDARLLLREREADNAQAALVLRESMSRSDFTDVERDQFLEILSYRIFSFRRVAAQAVKTMQEHLSAQDDVIRYELWARRWLLVAGLSLARYARLFMKLAVRETLDRQGLEGKANAGFLRISSQFWMH
jgi:hypothetical protein